MMKRLACRHGFLFLILVIGFSCQKKADPAPALTRAILDSAQSIQSRDLTATSVRLSSLLRSSGNEAVVTIGQLCSTTNQHPTLEDKD
ncbi:hypothetical protein, partial [Fibrella forsythiae]